MSVKNVSGSNKKMCDRARNAVITTTGTGRRYRSRVIAVMLAAFAVVAPVNIGVAEASDVPYVDKQVVVRHSGMCLNVAHASPYNGASVVQATCSGYNNERWTFRHVDTDWWTGYRFYQVVVKHSGKCLDVKDGSKDHAAPVIQYSCNGGGNQQWRFVDLGNGYSFLIARHSDMCLNVAYASMQHAAPVVQAICSNGPNEHWRLR